MVLMYQTIRECQSIFRGMTSNLLTGVNPTPDPPNWLDGTHACLALVICTLEYNFPQPPQNWQQNVPQTTPLKYYRTSSLIFSDPHSPFDFFGQYELIPGENTPLAFPLPPTPPGGTIFSGQEQRDYVCRQRGFGCCTHLPHLLYLSQISPPVPVSSSGDIC